MKVLGKKEHSETLFAVKGGGHSFNPGFSSTPGVHISLSRLKGVTLGSERDRVTLGMGGICKLKFLVIPFYLRIHF